MPAVCLIFHCTSWFLSTLSSLKVIHFWEGGLTASRPVPSICVYVGNAPYCIFCGAVNPEPGTSKLEKTDSVKDVVFQLSAVILSTVKKSRIDDVLCCSLAIHSLQMKAMGRQLK